MKPVLFESQITTSQLRETWGDDAFFQDGPTLFSPSGHALAFVPLNRGDCMGVIEIRFADGRESLVMEHRRYCRIVLCSWASDDEIVFHEMGDEDYGLAPSLWAYSISSGIARHLMDCGDSAMSVVYGGKPEHVSILGRGSRGIGLFDLDVSTAVLQRLTAFDASLHDLAIYARLGHAWCRERQEAALIAWPGGEYLPDGVTPTEENSQWDTELAKPAEDDDEIVTYGNKAMTRRAFKNDVMRRTPYRLFLVGHNGKRTEFPGTAEAHRPLFSADFSVLSFEQRSPTVVSEQTGTFASTWLLKIADRSLTRIGACRFLIVESTVIHPAGFMICYLYDESIPATDGQRERYRSGKWYAFRVRNGEANPV